MQALNLVGSILKRSPGLKAIYVYDLGLTAFQRFQFKGIPGVTLKKVPPFVKHWRQCWSWKPWIWLNTPANNLMFLDAGTEVLRDLSEIAECVLANEYFLVSQYETSENGHTLSDIVPSGYYQEFGLDTSVSKNPVVAGGIVGFKTSSEFFHKVITGTYELVIKGYNLGWSEHELWRNKGINQLEDPAVRDCPYFRHDQTLLNLLLYKYIENPVIQPVNKYGGFHSPQDHPEQVIWNSRDHNPLAFVNHIEYRGSSRGRNQINHLYLLAAELRRTIKALKCKVLLKSRM